MMSVVQGVVIAMGRDACKIKGSRDGLVITISEGAEFLEVVQHLKKKLSSAQNFFAGASIKLAYEGEEFTGEQVDEITQVVQEFGMNFDGEQPVVNPQVAVTESVFKESSSETATEPTLLVRRTIRSGQKIHYDGNVVVMGDVNPGAEIVCSGDIVILGSLRGVAHAGVGGKVEATVFAFRLEPTQLRIAHYISRAPDEKIPQPLGPEVARVVDNMIQISAYS